MIAETEKADVKKKKSMLERGPQQNHLIFLRIPRFYDSWQSIKLIKRNSSHTEASTVSPIIKYFEDIQSSPIERTNFLRTNIHI